MEYKAIYKCRLCGETYCSGCTTGKTVALASLLELNLGIRGTVVPAPTMTDTHNCGGDHAGSLGLADFLGWEMTGERRRAYEEKTESGLLEED